MTSTLVRPRAAQKAMRRSLLRRRMGRQGLNAAIGVSAVIMVAGIVLWGVQLSGGMVQTGMRNLSSWGLYITSFMFFVGLSAGGLIISSVPSLWHRGLRRHLQGGRHELHRLHRGRHRHGGGRPRPAGAPMGAVRLLQPRQPAHVGHRGARNLPHPVLRVPVGPGAGRRGQGVPHRPARDLGRGARHRRARALGDAGSSGFSKAARCGTRPCSPPGSCPRRLCAARRS